MPAPENRLSVLFEQYLSHTLTPEDRQAFLELVALNHTEQELKSLIEKEMERLHNKLPGTAEMLPAEQAHLIFERIIQEKAAATKLVFINRRTIAWISSVAAVLLLMAGFYNWSHRGVTALPVPPMKSLVKDVAPGVNGAILTLADGSKVLLDSLHSGNITRQGNTSIIKQNGGITYNASGAAQQETLYNTLTTPRAHQYQLELPDGSKVWLNAASSITYPTTFTGYERTVTVTGEVYLEVMPDKQRPFFVKYGNKKAEVLGTHFNVNAYEDETDSRVTLLEGSIRMYNGVNTGLLKPGQQAALSKTGEAIRILDDVDTEQVMAWKNGHFDFREADLKTIMRQLMRWYDVEVEYQGQVPQRFFTADVSRNKNLSAVLAVLELNKIHFYIENKKIIVTP